MPTRADTKVGLLISFYLTMAFGAVSPLYSGTIAMSRLTLPLHTHKGQLARTGESSHSQTCNEPADGDLSDRPPSASLDRGADREDCRPDEDGPTTTEAVRRECLSQGANKGTTQGSD